MSERIYVPDENAHLGQQIGNIAGPVGGAIGYAIGSAFDFGSDGQAYPWGYGWENGSVHSESPPVGLREGKDYYWEYGAWKYSGNFVAKVQSLLTLIGEQARTLAPGYISQNSKQQLESTFLSTAPSTFIPNPNDVQLAVYAI